MPKTKRVEHEKSPTVFKKKLEFFTKHIMSDTLTSDDLQNIVREVSQELDNLTRTQNKSEGDDIDLSENIDSFKKFSELYFKKYCLSLKNSFEKLQESTEIFASTKTQEDNIRESQYYEIEKHSIDLHKLTFALRLFSKLQEDFFPTLKKTLSVNEEFPLIFSILIESLIFNIDLSRFRQKNIPLGMNRNTLSVHAFLNIETIIGATIPHIVGHALAVLIKIWEFSPELKERYRKFFIDLKNKDILFDKLYRALRNLAQARILIKEGVLTAEIPEITTTLDLANKLCNRTTAKFIEDFFCFSKPIEFTLDEKNELVLKLQEDKLSMKLLNLYREFIRPHESTAIGYSKFSDKLRMLSLFVINSLPFKNIPIAKNTAHLMGFWFFMLFKRKGRVDFNLDRPLEISLESDEGVGRTLLKSIRTITKSEMEVFIRDETSRQIELVKNYLSEIILSYEMVLSSFEKTFLEEATVINLCLHVFRDIQQDFSTILENQKQQIEEKIKTEEAASQKMANELLEQAQEEKISRKKQQKPSKKKHEKVAACSTLPEKESTSEEQEPHEKRSQETTRISSGEVLLDNHTKMFFEIYNKNSSKEDKQRDIDALVEKIEKTIPQSNTLKKELYVAKLYNLILDILTLKSNLILRSNSFLKSTDEHIQIIWLFKKAEKIIDQAFHYLHECSPSKEKQEILESLNFSKNYFDIAISTLKEKLFKSAKEYEEKRKTAENKGFIKKTPGIPSKRWEEFSLLSQQRIRISVELLNINCIELASKLTTGIKLDDFLKMAKMECDDLARDFPSFTRNPQYTKLLAIFSKNKKEYKSIEDLRKEILSSIKTIEEVISKIDEAAGLPSQKDAGATSSSFTSSMRLLTPPRKDNPAASSETSEKKQEPTEVSRINLKLNLDNSKFSDFTAWLSAQLKTQTVEAVLKLMDKEGILKKWFDPLILSIEKNKNYQNYLHQFIRFTKEHGLSQIENAEGMLSYMLAYVVFLTPQNEKDAHSSNALSTEEKYTKQQERVTELLTTFASQFTQETEKEAQDSLHAIREGIIHLTVPLILKALQDVSEPIKPLYP